MVPGSDGGMGSGVRIQFKQIINFDLICLYSNVKAERFLQRPINARLVAGSNKLLKSDVNINEGNKHISTGCSFSEAFILAPITIRSIQKVIWPKKYQKSLQGLKSAILAIFQ